MRGEKVFIALGSNVGDRSAHLQFASEAIAAIPGCEVVGSSSISETEALTMDGEPQENYLNQMLMITTSLEPLQLLHELQRIEIEGGRKRTGRWAPRTLDLDIVLFGDRRITSDILVVPHPELNNREFWRSELLELQANS